MTIAFRVTPEENDLVNLLAKTANMTKQEYIMSKLTDTTIVVQPSTRTFKALKDAIAKVYVELSRIRRAGDMSEALTEKIEVLANMLQDLGAKIPRSQLDAEESEITGMKRE
ncbi:MULTISPECIES: plasmid mobilization protein [Eggerthellaceae]|uniref:Mobilization protein n=2 Tax=Eggerthellaceae TaxID=1643826 RepID=A0A2K2UA71_9ACTN|nr:MULTISPECIES: hypothetical protein [Eggerthellaceae]MDJ1650562.1 hypothetical protein [Gordonibacter sp. KGMB12511]PNV67108.1 hypothetical protein C2L71_09985 [Enteroscipio rubneri]